MNLFIAHRVYILKGKVNKPQFLLESHVDFHFQIIFRGY